MVSIKLDSNIKDLQLFVKEVYSLSNDRYFEIADMLCNIQRFAMRGLKGIRKGDIEKTEKNLIISLSWFTSLLSRLKVDLEEEVWKRFPYLCSYCASCPCSCKAQHVEKRQEVSIDDSKRPKTLADVQKMFNEIYPSSSRTLEHAGVHFAEEIGEFSEMLLAYKGERKEEDFQKFKIEAADCFSCLIGVFNSLNIDLAKVLANLFYDNCHICHKAPCECSYTYVKTYKS